MKLRKQMKIQISFLILFLYWQMNPNNLSAQPPMPFTKGVNLTNWFQLNEVGQIQINNILKKTLNN
jgi:hypothetical protein